MKNRRHFILQSVAAISGSFILPAVADDRGTTRRSENARCAANAVSRNEAKIAEQLVRARLDARVLERFPGTYPADLASAYRCQDAGIALWPRPIAGWKVAGRFAPAQVNIVGPAFEGNVVNVAPGEVVDCPVFVGGFGGIEAEVVVRVGKDAPPDQIQWSTAEAVDMVGEVCIGAEVASSPLHVEPSASMVISDFGSCYGLLVGSPIPDWETRSGITMKRIQEDRVVNEGTRPVRDDILEVFRVTLEICARRGHPLRAGMVIATGGHWDENAYHKPSYLPFAPTQRTSAEGPGFQAGVTSRIVYEGIGEFTTRTVPATGGVWNP